MKKKFKSFKSINIYILKFFGLNPVALIENFKGTPKYLFNLFKLYFQIKKSSKKYLNFPSAIKLSKPLPEIYDPQKDAGSASGHYYHQDLLVANKIFKKSPEIHLDIASRIDGLISHLLSFEQKLLVGDIRPLNIKNENCEFIQINLLDENACSKLQKFESISCLHAIEHMGLGRFGDPIDYLGHLKAINNLSKLLSKGGTLYLSHPVGQKGRIQFNAHRIISLVEVFETFKNCDLMVTEFAYVDDKGELIKIDDITQIDYKNSFFLRHGCAIWTLKKQRYKNQ